MIIRILCAFPSVGDVAVAGDVLGYRPACWVRAELKHA